MEQLSEQAQNLLQLIPESGSIGNVTLRKKLAGTLPPGIETAAPDFFSEPKSELLAAGVIKLGRGKGGSVRRAILENPESGQVETDTHTLEVAATEEF